MHIMQSSGAQITNNIFYDDDVGYMIATDSMPDATGDYNLFFRTDAGHERRDPERRARPRARPAAAPCRSTSPACRRRASRRTALYGDPLWSAAVRDASTPTRARSSRSAARRRSITARPSPTHRLRRHGDPARQGPDIGAFEQ